MSEHLTLPLSETITESLKAGDSIFLSGTLITARDTAHKWLVETFIRKTNPIFAEDQKVYESILPILDHGAIYHCGPIVSGLESQDYHFVSAGPTTSTREEPYQADVIHHFNLKAVIGKGGMGKTTLSACQEFNCVYFQAVGGAAAVAADCVTKVKVVYKLEFGIPEALWVIEVKDFPLTITMDTHGVSLHETVRDRSKKQLEVLLKK